MTATLEEQPTAKEGGSGRVVRVIGPVVDVERLAQHVPDVSEGGVADRHRDRRAGVLDGSAADQAVGRLHRDRAHHVVADVLLDLEGEGLGLAAVGDVDVQREVDLRHRLGRELHVDDRADDPGDATSPGRGLVFC